MKRIVIALALTLTLGLFLGCAKKQKFHQTDLPDPKSYEAHFHEVDSNSDGVVTWEEFITYFPQGELRVFEILDMNKDKVVNHDEWHQFEEAHGSKNHGRTSSGSY
ncbi:MAG: EF-hand domain-containing protein [Deltaproteobacteria bacterium]|nr:EF-hand domain-containing protein [Deltaproteobacteria bacterium]